MGLKDFNVDPQEQFYTLMACVEQCCIDLDLSSVHYGNKLLSWSAIGLRELHLDTAQEVIAAVLEVNDVLTADLPGDFVDYVMIGEIQNQYVKPLCVNDKLTATPRTVANWNPTNHQPGLLPNGTDFSGYGGWVFARYWWGGGLPQKGHFRVVTSDHGCKQLLLDTGITLCNNLIYLEYITTGFNPCGQTVLHPYLYEYVRAYIHHQWAKFGKKADKSEAEIFRTGRDVWHQEQVVKGRVNGLTPTDLLRISRKNTRLTNHA